jgi:hypothetical protein
MTDEDTARCVLCEDQLPDRDRVYYADLGTEYEGKPVCEICYYEADPAATLYYGDDQTPHLLTAVRNDTEGEFRIGWCSTDPWRGYYELHSSDYSQVFSDAILAWHESEAMLKELHDRLRDKFGEAHVPYVRAFLRTSNVFSTGLDFWVGNEPLHLLSAYGIVQKAKQEVGYHDPVYSTGILIPRETLTQLQQLLPSKYAIATDADLLRLVEHQGEELLEELRRRLG